MKQLLTKVWNVVYCRANLLILENITMDFQASHTPNAQLQTLQMNQRETSLPSFLIYVLSYISLCVHCVTIFHFTSSKDCQSGSLNATLASGKIVLCFSTSDEQDIVSASATVKKAGGIGLIYAEFPNDGLESCKIPCIKVDYTVGTQILLYIRKAR